MYIHTLKIQNLGRVRDLTLSLKDNVNVIEHPFPDEIALAVGCITNSKTMRQSDRHMINCKTKLTAAVSLKEMIYDVKVIFDKETDERILCAWDSSGKDITAEYLNLTSHCTEQDLSDVFDGDEQPALLRFLDYKNESGFLRGRALERQTGGVSCLDSFRLYLSEFIKNFRQERIAGGKNFEIVLQKNGLYGVRCVGADDSPVHLSETERRIFQYLCFLKTADFWCGFEKIRNMHDEIKPLVVTNFLERIDEAIDVGDILDKTRKLKRQVILLKKR